MKNSPLLAVLVCLLILVPLVKGEDAIRHQDPDNLKSENPYWLNLYMFYDLAYNSIVAEKYEAISDWLKYADEIYATTNLANPLKSFSSLIGNVSKDLNSTKSQIEAARKYLQQSNLSGASTALDQALVSLRAANTTVDRLDVMVKQIASTLKSSPDPLLKNNQKLRELIAKYLEMINGLKNDVTFNKIIDGEPVSPEDWDKFFNDYPELDPSDFTPSRILEKQTKLMLVEPNPVMIGDLVNVFGKLTNSSSVGLSLRRISIYFNDELITIVDTQKDGSFSVILKTPYLYDENLIVQAKYRPTSEDLISHLPSFANVELELIYFTPTLDVSAPSFIYPGTIAEFTGFLSYSGAPLPDHSIRVTGLGGSNVAVTGVDGAFRAAISVPEDYPSSTAQVVVHAEPRGIYGPVERILNVKVVRVKTTISASCDLWAFSGSSLLIKGVVMAEGLPLSNCEVLVKSIFGEFTTETRVDGSYEVSCILPDSVFTGRSDFNVYASPVEPWIDSSKAETNIFIVNVFSILAGVILVGAGAYSLSKRAKIKPKKQIVVAPTVKAASYEASVKVETVEVIEQKELKSQILGAIEYIRGITGIEFKPSATIREYLSNVKARLEDKTYELFSNVMFSYERWLYGRPAGYKKDVLTRILDYFNEMFENES